MLRSAFLVAGWAAIASAGLPARAASCTLRTGTPVSLRSSDFDPDVFVWDTQRRAIVYSASAHAMSTDEVLRHTVLARAGTRAVVVGCAARTVHPEFAHGVEDAVLLRITSGANAGRIGWVASGDVRS